jgi:hypothetical protein
MGYRVRQAVEYREQPVHARVRQDPADRRAPRSNPQLSAGGVRVFQRHDQRTEGVPVASRRGRQVHHDDGVIRADGHEGFPEPLGVRGVDLHQRGHDRQATVCGDPDNGLVGTVLVGTAGLVRAVGQRLMLSARQARLADVPGRRLSMSAREQNRMAAVSSTARNVTRRSQSTQGFRW